MPTREAVVAGQFYPQSPDALLKQISGLIDTKALKEKALGVILPHAGYMYSASVACAVISKLKNFDNYVILGPNHSGIGAEISVYDGDVWKTPLGEVSVNKELVKKLVKNKLFELDSSAHQYEHSIEVMLPLLQFVNKDFSFVPIVIKTGDLKLLKMAGKILAEAIKECKSVLVIASSDMTHYESQDSVNRKDERAIEAIEKLDEELLMQEIQEHEISMCGFGPVIIMLSCLKQLGAKKSRLVKHQTSGDVSGDYSSVVGYAGMIVS